MDILTKSRIKELFTDAVYHRGHRYFIEGRVRDLVFDSVRESWHAKIRGTKQYQVTVRMDEDGIEAECNCPAFDQYFDPCKHVAAVLLKILQSESQTSTEPISSVSYQQQLKVRQMRQEQERQKLQLDLERQQQERQKIYVKHLTNEFIQAFANHQ